LGLIDKRTAKDIDLRINTILREIGVKEPPLNISDVEQFLLINKSFYDLEDPELLDKIKHKLQIGQQKVKKIINKINLRALFFSDTNQIAIDQNVPASKHKWVTAHEIIHKILPTHNQLLIGDTAETLDPDYHDMMEGEANYGASSLIFLNNKFTKEAKDYECNLESVFCLSKRYKNSKTSTIRRYVETNNSSPIAAIVSKPAWKTSLNGNERCRYFIKSNLFLKMFSNIDKNLLMTFIDINSHRCAGGPCGKATNRLFDINGDGHEFLFESFYNRYDILTLISHLKQF